jgi:hypothetical protein
VVRCRRGPLLAGALRRLALGVVSERPRPGGWRARWSGFSGCGSGGTQDSSFVRGRAEASAFATGFRRERRSVRASAREGSIVGGLGGGVGSASPFSWHGPREGRSLATSGPLGGGSATCRALRRLQIHRWDEHTQILASTPAPTRGPSTRAAAVASRPVEALAERRTTRGRASAAPPERQAAPTQSHGPRSHPDAAAGRARSRTGAPAGRDDQTLSPPAPPGRRRRRSRAGCGAGARGPGGG